MREEEFDRMTRDNAGLLLDLMAQKGARDLGDIHYFFVTPFNWRCPICCRSKPEFARLDKNGDLLCCVRPHHDHYGDLAWRKFPKPETRDLRWGIGGDALVAGFRRF